MVFHEEILIPILYGCEFFTIGHEIESGDDIFVMIDEPPKLLRRKEDIRVNPHYEIVIEFAVEGFLVFASPHVPAEAHVSYVVDIAGLFSAEEHSDTFYMAVMDQLGPAFEELSGERVSGKAEDNDRRFGSHDISGVKPWIVSFYYDTI